MRMTDEELRRLREREATQRLDQIHEDARQLEELLHAREEDAALAEGAVKRTIKLGEVRGDVRVMQKPPESKGGQSMTSVFVVQYHHGTWKDMHEHYTLPTAKQELRTHKDWARQHTRHNYYRVIRRTVITNEEVVE